MRLPSAPIFCWNRSTAALVSANCASHSAAMMRFSQYMFSVVTRVVVSRRYAGVSSTFGKNGTSALNGLDA